MRVHALLFIGIWWCDWSDLSAGLESSPRWRHEPRCSSRFWMEEEASLPLAVFVELIEAWLSRYSLVGGQPRCWARLPRWITVYQDGFISVPITEMIHLSCRVTEMNSSWYWSLSFGETKMNHWGLATCCFLRCGLDSLTQWSSATCIHFDWSKYSNHLPPIY